MTHLQVGPSQLPQTPSLGGTLASHETATSFSHLLRLAGERGFTTDGWPERTEHFRTSGRSPGDADELARLELPSGCAGAGQGPSRNSQAWVVAMTTHCTNSAHSVSLSSTAGPSGSCEIVSNRMNCSSSCRAA